MAGNDWKWPVMAVDGSTNHKWLKWIKIVGNSIKKIIAVNG